MIQDRQLSQYLLIHTCRIHLRQLLEKEKTNVVVEGFDQYRNESIKQDTQEKRNGKQKNCHQNEVKSGRPFPLWKKFIAAGENKKELGNSISQFVQT